MPEKSFCFVIYFGFALLMFMLSIYNLCNYCRKKKSPIDNQTLLIFIIWVKTIILFLFFYSDKLNPLSFIPQSHLYLY